MYGFKLMVVAVTVQAFLLPISSDLISNNLVSLRASKVHLEEILSSLTTEPQIMIEHHNPNEDIYIIPRTLLNSHSFEKLGLKTLIDESSNLKLTIENDQTHENLLIPKDCKSLFLFNSSKLSKVPALVSGELILAKFIESVPPFQIPELTDLLEYYLVLPKAYLQRSIPSFDIEGANSVYSRLVIKRSEVNLPVFRTAVSGGQPLLVFHFGEREFNISPKKTKLTSIMNIKNYLPLKGQGGSVSTFFDSYARNWVQNNVYDNLIHSVFCSSSNDEGYCLRIPDKSQIELLHMFNKRKSENTKDLAADFIEGTTGNVSHIQTNSRNEIQQDEYRPHAAFEGFDEKVQDKPHVELQQQSFSRNKGIIKVKRKRDEGTEENESSFYFPLSWLRLDEPIIKFPRTSSLTQVYYPWEHVGFNEQSDRRTKDSQSSDSLKGESVGSYVMATTPIVPTTLMITSSSEIAVSQNLKDVEEFHGSIEQKGILHVESKLPYISFHYSNKSADTTNRLHRRGTIFSQEEDCEKVTWFNIFHHSIFGKPKFCEE